MTSEDNKKSPERERLRVRFLGSVKCGGRWFDPGCEALLDKETARMLHAKGLVELVDGAGKGSPRGNSVSRKDNAPRRGGRK